MFYFFYCSDFFLIKKFKKFKERIRFEFKIAIHNVLFK